MALEREDRIKEQTATTGTGAVTLDGTSPTGFLGFSGNISDGATVRYLIETIDQSEWEVGEGIFTATGTTLSRDTIYSSSNSGSLVNFSAVTKNVSVVFTKRDIEPLYDLAEGQMLNGKIVPSVATDNLTVALKTLAGNDPSASDPAFVMINGTMRNITSALSVTANTATNWFNAGSAELATKEIDYFVYLGYNATDGVTIGFARIPSANSYDDFSATNTDEKYCAISTITTASATDYYNVIGRFAATLSAGTGYTWTVPTFTAKNLIQRPIYETRWLNWNLTWDLSTVDDGSGGQPSTASNSKYEIMGKTCNVMLKCEAAAKVGIGVTILSSSGSVPFSPITAFHYTGIGTLLSEWGTGEKRTAILGINGYGDFRIYFTTTLADNDQIYANITGAYRI